MELVPLQIRRLQSHPLIISFSWINWAWDREERERGACQKTRHIYIWFPAVLWLLTTQPNKLPIFSVHSQLYMEKQGHYYFGDPLTKFWGHWLSSQSHWFLARVWDFVPLAVLDLIAQWLTFKAVHLSSWGIFFSIVMRVSLKLLLGFNIVWGKFSRVVELTAKIYLDFFELFSYSPVVIFICS